MQGMCRPRTSCHLERKEQVECGSVGTLAHHLVNLFLLVKIRLDKGELCQHLHVTTTYLQKGTLDSAINVMP